MGEIVLSGLFVAAGSGLGAALGWWIRGTRARSSAPQSLNENPIEQVTLTPENALLAAQMAPPVPTESTPGPARESVDVAAFEQVMAKVQELTETVAADVGLHSSNIQEISQELYEGGVSEASVIAIVERLVETNEVMQARLQTAEERLQDQAREMEAHVREARTDALTKLGNRRAFDDEMKRAEEEAAQEGRLTCVLMMDVDHFKKFNDTYGHQAGDEVLRGVARVLNESLTEAEVVCRYGGEEFAVIFPGVDLEQARTRAERAREAIGQEVFEFDGMDLRVTASAGLAQLQAGESADDLVKRADEALYVCKEVGRNNGHWHDGQRSYPMNEPVADRQIDVELELDEAPSEDDRDRINGVSDCQTFKKDVDRRIAEYKRGGAGMSVIVIDIDEFEKMTTTYGEKVGEIVLRATAQFLKATMREMDHVARLDESEFGLLLPSASLGDANTVAERLRNAVQRCTLPVDGESLRFSVSLGTTEVAESDDTNALIGRAQMSARAAKKDGGNCIVFANQSGDPQTFAISSPTSC